MTIPLLLLIISLVSLVSVLFFDRNHSSIGALILGISLVMTACSFLVCVLATNHRWTRFEPTSYSIYETPREVIAVTPTQTFTTSDLEKANDWKTSPKGWVVKSYNYFGLPSPDSPQLTTKNPVNDQ